MYANVFWNINYLGKRKHGVLNQTFPILQEEPMGWNEQC